MAAACGGGGAGSATAPTVDRKLSRDDVGDGSPARSAKRVVSVDT